MPAWRRGREGQGPASSCEETCAKKCASMNVAAYSCDAVARADSSPFIDRRQGAYCSYGIVPHRIIVMRGVADRFFCRIWQKNHARRYSSLIFTNKNSPSELSVTRTSVPPGAADAGRWDAWLARCAPRRHGATGAERAVPWSCRTTAGQQQTTSGNSVAGKAACRQQQCIGRSGSLRIRG